MEPLPPGEPTIVRPTYPHMGQLDALIWSAWLPSCDHELGLSWYDLKVGSPIALPPGATPEMIRLADGTGSKRIDVLCEVDDELWCIEVKPYITHVALGQVLAYAHLVAERYTLDRPLRPALICGEHDPDLEQLVSLQGIILEHAQPNPLAHLMPYLPSSGLGQA